MELLLNFGRCHLCMPQLFFACSEGGIGGGGGVESHLLYYVLRLNFIVNMLGP